MPRRNSTPKSAKKKELRKETNEAWQKKQEEKARKKLYHDALGRRIEAFQIRKQNLELQLKAGQKLRRTPFDYLEENGLTDISNLIGAIYDVRAKRSNHPKKVRDFIAELHNEAISEAIQIHLKNKENDKTD